MLWGADPLSANRQVSYYLSAWGDALDRAKSVVIDPRYSATAAKSDEWMPVKPGGDGALAVAMAHVILTEGLWYKPFVGDFVEGENLFVAGQEVDEEAFEEIHTFGLVKWWNLELKDKTPEWAHVRTGVEPELIRASARLIGSARPATNGAMVCPDLCLLAPVHADPVRRSGPLPVPGHPCHFHTHPLGAQSVRAAAIQWGVGGCGRRGTVSPSHPVPLCLHCPDLCQTTCHLRRRHSH